MNQLKHSEVLGLAVDHTVKQGKDNRSYKPNLQSVKIQLSCLRANSSVIGSESPFSIRYPSVRNDFYSGLLAVVKGRLSHHGLWPFGKVFG